MWSMDLCGITVIEFRAGRPVLRAHNLTAHLAPVLDDGGPGRARASRGEATGAALTPVSADGGGRAGGTRAAAGQRGAGAGRP